MANKRSKCVLVHFDFDRHPIRNGFRIFFFLDLSILGGTSKPIKFSKIEFENNRINQQRLPLNRNIQIYPKLSPTLFYEVRGYFYTVNIAQNRSYTIIQN